MKITIDNIDLDIPAVWMDNENTKVKMINQSLLPHVKSLYESDNYHTTADAIENMIIRGAPTIGATAAYGYVQAVFEYEKFSKDEKFLSEAYKRLLNTRPTAIDLKHGLMHVNESIQSNTSFSSAKRAADNFVNDLVEEARKISLNGISLLSEGINVLTHCNTGPLATIEYGTALGPILMAKQKGIENIHVYIDETRPRLQGARLTSFELIQAEISSTVLTDSTAGFLMKKGLIDMVIVGADRVTSNGDVANKIGTYSLAILCKYHNIPFYTAFPSSTYDHTISDGDDIKIEERDSEEVTTITGKSSDGTMKRVKITLDGVNAINYAFDVTPAQLITGYITPIGILTKENLYKLRS